MHVALYGKARGLSFGLSLIQRTFFVFARFEGFGETARMRMLVRVCVARRSNKYQRLSYVLANFTFKICHVKNANVVADVKQYM